MADKQTTSGGIGFAGLLTIVFITLKLTHFIDWRWYWVLAPLWVPLSVVLATCIVIGLVALGALAFESKPKRIWR